MMNEFAPGTLLRVVPNSSPNLISQHPDGDVKTRKYICSLKNSTICMVLEFGEFSTYWSSDVIRVLSPFGIGWVCLKFFEKL